ARRAAMGVGKAVISSDVGGVSEWLRNRMNGLLVEKENPDALAEALANCGNNPELVEQLKAAGARTFERHFTLDRFAARFAELLVTLKRRSTLPGDDYQEWIARFDTPTPAARAALRRELRVLPRQPAISIILP